MGNNGVAASLRISPEIKDMGFITNRVRKIPLGESIIRRAIFQSDFWNDSDWLLRPGHIEGSGLRWHRSVTADRQCDLIFGVLIERTHFRSMDSRP
jgi:hypothetical protein